MDRFVPDVEERSQAWLAAVVAFDDGRIDDARLLLRTDSPDERRRLVESGLDLTRFFATRVGNLPETLGPIEQLIVEAVAQMILGVPPVAALDELAADPASTSVILAVLAELIEDYAVDRQHAPGWWVKEACLAHAALLASR